MGERRNLKKQSLVKLQQDLEQTEHRIEVEERRRWWVPQPIFPGRNCTMIITSKFMITPESRE